MKRGIAGVCFLINLFAFFTSEGQTPVFKNYNVKDGLASADVYDMVQDSAGYIWFATEHGVSRFDGINFKNYTTADGLADNIIIWIKKDFYGRIWAVPLTGLPAYFANGSFHIIKLERQYKGFNIRSYAEDSLHTVWFSCQTGLIGIDPDNSVHIETFEDTPEIQCVAPDNKLGLIMENLGSGYHSNQLFFWSKKTGIEIFHPNENPAYNKIALSYGVKLQYLSPFMSIFQWKDHQMNITDSVQLNNWNLLERDLNPSEYLIFPLSIDKDRIWASSKEKGLITVERNYAETRHYQNYLPGKAVSRFLEDKENNLWVSTIGNGVFLFSSRNNVTYFQEDGLYANHIVSLSGDSQNIWLGYGDPKVNILSEKKFRVLDLQKEGIAKHRVLQFLNHSDGSVWIATDEHIGILKKGVLSVFKIDQFGTSGAAIKCITENFDGSVLAGTHNNFYRIKDGKYRDLGKQYNLYSLRVTALYVSPDSTIWVGSGKGVYKIKGDSICYLGTGCEQLSKRISDIKQLRDKTICISTGNDGVVFLKNDKYYFINNSIGLSGNICNRICIDPEEEKTLWVGTSHGLNRVKILSLEKNSFEIKVYDSDHGLTSDEVNGVFIRRDSVWVATSNGLTVFRKNSSGTSKIPPPVYITNISVNDRDTVIKEKYSFPYQMNNIKISFTGISFKSMGKIIYRYKMLGLDSNWNYTPFPFVQYAALPPGRTYTFFVSAKDIDENWSDRSASCSFSISLPFWQSWWFRAIILFIFLGSVMGIFRIRLNSVRKKDKEKTSLNRKIADMELKALRAQMNPHFTFNSLNSIQHIVTKNDMPSAQKYLSKFSMLMRRTLDNSRLAVITLDEEINTLRLYLELESLRFENQFEYLIRVDPSIDGDNCRLPAMLIQPFLENAIWHGLLHKEGPRKLTMEVTSQKDCILCVIEDNGVGRKNSMELKSKLSTKHQSHGMDVTRERLDLLGITLDKKFLLQITDLEDHAGKPCGTKVELTIPVQTTY